MATIVTQAHAPWWGNLAAGVLGTLINNAITSSQQANQNAKTNALLSEAYKINDTPGRLSGLSDNAFNASTNNLLGDVINANAPTLADPNAGYNFNNNVYQQAGYNNLNYGTPAVNNGLSLAKIMQALANEPNRFKSVNMADMAKIAEPYVQEAQKARERAELENLANAVYQGGNFNPEQLGRGYIQGRVGDNVFNNLMGQNVLTPQQQAELDYRNMAMAEEARQFDAKLNQGAYQFGANLDYMRGRDDTANNQWQQQFNANQDERDYNRTHPQRQTIVTDNNSVYTYDPRGTTAGPLTDMDGNPLRISPHQKAEGKQPEVSQTMQFIKEHITDLNNQINALQELQSQYKETEVQYSKYGKQIEGVQQQIDDYEIAKTYELLRNDPNNPMLNQTINHQIKTYQYEYGKPPQFIPTKQAAADAGGNQAQTPAATASNDVKPQGGAANATIVKANGDTRREHVPNGNNSDSWNYDGLGFNLPSVTNPFPTPAAPAAKSGTGSKTYTVTKDNEVTVSGDDTPTVGGEIISGDATQPISSTNNRNTVNVDVTGGNPNGNISSVNKQERVMGLSDVQQLYNEVMEGKHGFNHNIKTVGDLVKYLTSNGFQVNLNLK